MSQPILELRHINKRFPGVQALDDVSVTFYEGQITGLLGENGAGKSTLLKIMAGFYQPDEGEILMREERIAPRSVKEAGSYGIGMVFQEQALLGNLTVAENIYLGNEEPFMRWGVLNWKAMFEAARAQLTRIGYSIDPRVRTDKLSFAHRQMVEVARVMALAGSSAKTPIIIFDEPTTVGCQEDIENLFATIRRLKEQGASILFISHRLEETMELCDRVYILKDGRYVTDKPVAETNLAELHRLMVGREKNTAYYRESDQRAPDADIALRLQHCSRQGKFEDVSLDIHRGEIFGVAGVLGSGREELSRSIAGITPFSTGEVWVNGKQVVISSPERAKQLGIGYVPVERRREGLIQYFGVAANITLANSQLAAPNGWLQGRQELQVAQEWIKQLSIKVTSPNVLAMTLSGGNQQKVVLAKWLAAGVKILVLDHPTRGIDVGAKEEVYGLIRKLASEGMAILLTSDALPETIGLSNRIAVMRDGRVQVILDAPVGQKPEEYEIAQHMC